MNTGICLDWRRPIIHERRRGWLGGDSYAQIRAVLLNTMLQHDLLCPMYCLMPDHVHLMWLGGSENADQLMAMRFFRRETGRLLKPYSWQKQAYDHVLREEERKRGAFAVVCRYILENPVRAGLCEDWQDYPFSGAGLSEGSELDPRQMGYWEEFWRMYVERRERVETRRAVVRGGHAADSAATSERGDAE